MRAIIRMNRIFSTYNLNPLLFLGSSGERENMIIYIYSVEFSIPGIIVCILSAIGVLLLFVLFIVKKHRQFFLYLFNARQCRFQIFGYSLAKLVVTDTDRLVIACQRILRYNLILALA